MQNYCMPDSSSFIKWMEYAANDLLVAQELQTGQPFVYRAILTHCQQSAEKYLKAFLLYNEHSFQKTHDLVILTKRCAEINIKWNVLLDDLAWLSTVYIESRYPDDFEEIDEEDAIRSIGIAKCVEEFIRGIL